MRLLAFCLLLSFGSKTNVLYSQSITGKIDNPDSIRTIKFSYYYKLLYRIDSARISKDGSFYKKLTTTEPTYAIIEYGKRRKEVYFDPASKLTIRFDPSTSKSFAESFRISGDMHINDYLDSLSRSNAYRNFLGQHVKYNLPIDSSKVGLAAFKIFSDSLRNAFFPAASPARLADPLKSFLKADSIESNSFSLISALDYMLLMRSGNKEEFWKNEVMQKIPFDSTGASLISNNYKVVLRFHFKRLLELQQKGKDSSYFREVPTADFMFETVKAGKARGQLQQYLFTEVLSTIAQEYPYCSFEMQRHYDSLINCLEGNITSAEFLASFNKSFAEVKRASINQLKGQPAHPFTVVDSSGKSYALNDFKGKLILLDLWASWCGPCIAEFPHIRKLIKRFENDPDFQVLSVSVDKTKNEWLNDGVAKVDPPGFPLWEGDKEALTKAYNIYQIPVLILIDQDGKFVEFNAPRASDGDKLYNLVKAKLKRGTSD